MLTIWSAASFRDSFSAPRTAVWYLRRYSASAAIIAESAATKPTTRSSCRRATSGRSSQASLMASARLAGWTPCMATPKTAAVAACTGAPIRTISDVIWTVLSAISRAPSVAALTAAMPSSRPRRTLAALTGGSPHPAQQATVTCLSRLGGHLGEQVVGCLPGGHPD